MEAKKAKLVNAFRVDHDKILILTWYRTIIFNTDLQRVSEVDVREEMDHYIKGLHCCNGDLSLDRQGYLVSFGVDEMTIDEDEFENVEQEVANN